MRDASRWRSGCCGAHWVYCRSGTCRKADRRYLDRRCRRPSTCRGVIACFSRLDSSWRSRCTGSGVPPTPTRTASEPARRRAQFILVGRQLAIARLPTARRRCQATLFRREAGSRAERVDPHCLLGTEGTNRRHTATGSETARVAGRPMPPGGQPFRRAPLGCEQKCHSRALPGGGQPVPKEPSCLRILWVGSAR